MCSLGSLVIGFQKQKSCVTSSPIRPTRLRGHKRRLLRANPLYMSYRLSGPQTRLMSVVSFRVRTSSRSNTCAWLFPTNQKVSCFRTYPKARHIQPTNTERQTIPLHFLRRFLSNSTPHQSPYRCPQTQQVRSRLPVSCRPGFPFPRYAHLHP